MALRTPALASLLLASACVPAPDPSAESEPPEIEWEGQWLRFGRAAGLDRQCAGVAPYMDRYVGELLEIFAIEGDATVDFFYVDEPSSACEALGCAKDNVVFSRLPVQEHELVHAVRSYAGFSHLLLEEGAAEYWGDDSTAFPFRQDTAGSVVAAAASASASGFPAEAYGVAGRFHAFLVEEASTATNELLRATSPAMGIDELAEHLERATDLPLEAWQSGFEAYPVCDQAEFRNASAACGSAPFVARCVGDTDAAIDVHVGCDDDNTLGPRDGEIWTYRTIELEEDGQYVFAVLPDLQMRGGWVALEHCDGGCGSTRVVQQVPASATPGQAFDAKAGTYVLRFTLPGGESGDFSVRVAGNCRR